MAYRGYEDHDRRWTSFFVSLQIIPAQAEKISYLSAWHILQKILKFGSKSTQQAQVPFAPSKSNVIGNQFKDFWLTPKALQRRAVIFLLLVLTTYAFFGIVVRQGSPKKHHEIVMSLSI